MAVGFLNIVFERKNPGKSLGAFQPFIFLQHIKFGIKIITSPITFPGTVL